MVILLVVISAYFVDGSCWLLMLILLMDISGYSIGGY